MILMHLDLGTSQKDISILLGVDPKTVYNVKAKFLKFGLELALYNKSRSGRPIEVDEKIRCQIVALACSNTPNGYDRWTLDLLKKTLRKELWEKFEVHYTPVHTYWLNQAEIAIAKMSRQFLGKSRSQNISVLKRKIKAWNKQTNRNPIPTCWKFTKEKAAEVFKFES